MQSDKALPPTARIGHPLNGLTLALYLVLTAWPTVSVNIVPSGGYGSDLLWSTESLIDAGGKAVLALLTGIVAGVAAQKSGSSEKQRSMGAKLGFLFGTIGMVSYLMALIPGFSRLPLMSMVIPLWLFALALLLFLSWAIARPFRGFGYLGIVIGIIGFVIVMVVDLLLLFMLMPRSPELMAVVNVIFAVVPPILAVVAAVLFEKIGRPSTTTV